MAYISVDTKAVLQLLKDMYTATGMDMGFVSADQSVHLNYPEQSGGLCRFIRKNERFNQKCQKCDRENFEKAGNERHIYRCHAGLTEGVFPIRHGERLFGWLVMGQALREEPDAQTFEQFYKRNQEYIREDELETVRELYYSRPVFSEDRLNAIASIIQMAAKYVFLSDLVKTADMPHIAQFKRYVAEHFKNPLTLGECAGALSINPYYLSHLIRNEMGTTFTAYLNRVRCEHARRLLEETGKSVGEAAIESGFSDGNYFSRVFRKLYGIPPSRIR